MRAFLDDISHRAGLEITGFRPVSGGDISAAYKIDTRHGAFFLKVNPKPFAGDMFAAEKMGLEAIARTRTIAVPRVLLTGTVDGKSFLLMQYVENRRPTPADFRELGRKLAQLHQCSSETFGFPCGNFIGSLPQNNEPHTGWPEFYWDERIFPQMDLAMANNLLRPSEIPPREKALGVFNHILGNPKPSLLHGDLWSGNYLISAKGTPFLIDPAIYYGHSMVDIAMSRLFGGFSGEFYLAYHEIVPKTEDYDAQIDLYQLYYLLVHLNLFGSSYLPSVNSILKHYFNP